MILMKFLAGFWVEDFEVFDMIGRVRAEGEADVI